ncbi:MAG: hypothetical protein QOG82_2358 [Actinomycetota bacterium]|nr:hypothetical protein [Actinomycetota bacterium]
MDELAEAIVQMHAAEMAARAALCELVAAFDAQEGWREDGSRSMTAWLAFRLGMGWSSAAELARVATALEDLPAISKVAHTGVLCWDQVAAVTSVATAETDGKWAETVPGMSTAQLQALARRKRDEAEPVRSVTCRLDRRRDWGRLSGRLPAAELELVAGALQRLADKMPTNPETGELDPYESRCADALVELAAQVPGDEAERPMVVVHIKAENLADGGDGETAGGAPVDNAEVRRLACDGRVEWVAEGADGTVGIGRARRRRRGWSGAFASGTAAAGSPAAAAPDGPTPTTSSIGPTAAPPIPII